MFFGLENDRSTVPEVGWTFCDNGLVVGAIVKLVQFVIASKLELENRFLM